VIGLNTVVFDNVPPNVTVLGVPGKVVGLPGRTFAPRASIAPPTSVPAPERKASSDLL
jgi:serine acetyltransferase